MNDQLSKILETGLQIGKQAAEQALGTNTETKGQDKKAEESNARWSPALTIGAAVALALVFGMLFLRRR